MKDDKQIEEIPKIKLPDYKMSDKGINEMRYIADEMQKAISNEYRKCIIADERKLEEVLKANGWRKSSDVAREIFAEIEMQLNEFNGSWADTVINTQYLIAELKKKYEES